jgi:hypothetical protein
MKKVLFLAVLCMSAIFTVNAQESPLKAYLGKYVFAAGSPVAEVTITLEDSSLMINSAMGSTAIEKKSVDTFYLAQYDASVIFKRGADKSVTEVAIIVQGMELVGKKETAAAPGSSNELKKEELYEIIWAEKQNQ